MKKQSKPPSFGKGMNTHHNVKVKYMQTTGRPLHADAGRTQPYIQTGSSKKGK